MRKIYRKKCSKLAIPEVRQPPQYAAKANFVAARQRL